MLTRDHHLPSAPPPRSFDYPYAGVPARVSHHDAHAPTPSAIHHAPHTESARTPFPRYRPNGADPHHHEPGPLARRAGALEPSLGLPGIGIAGTASIYVITNARLYRDGLRALLDRKDGFAVCGTAGTLTEALTDISHADLEPDIALVDVDPASAPGAVQMLRGQVPGLRIVVLGVKEADADVLRWVESGVDGYVPRDAPLDRLIETLRAVTRGESLCSPAVVTLLMQQVASLANATRPAMPPISPATFSSPASPLTLASPAGARPPVRPAANTASSVLTPRERQVAELIDEGLSNKQIALRLHIEMATVKNHVHNLLEKLGCTRRHEAAALLRAYG